MQSKFKLQKRDVLFTAICFGYNCLAYYFGRLLSYWRPHHNFSTFLDNSILFLPGFIIIYLGCYVFWVSNMYLASKQEPLKRKQFLIAHIAAENIAFLFFVFLPTTIIRPEVRDSFVPFIDFLVKLTYAADSPDNLFPSLHCYMSWMCWIAVRSNPEISKKYKWASFIMAVLVCMSTVHVKQHVFVDVPAGIILAEICNFISGIFVKKRASLTGKNS
ncbi:MAG: phosphatase PAP2 family protein [Treponema sp.]|nr:phosphatase PAP2 family protein [Treponema sp.]